MIAVWLLRTKGKSLKAIWFLADGLVQYTVGRRLLHRALVYSDVTARLRSEND